MKNVTTEYERDFHAWALENAALLRQRRFTEVDVDNIAEELDSMGRSERHELVNRLAVLLAHLLKWRFQPERRGKSWRATIQEQRLRIHEHLAESPSLRHHLESSYLKAYRYAVLRVTQETPLDETVLPRVCPFTWEQIVDEDYWPE